MILDWARNHPKLATPVPAAEQTVQAVRGATVTSGPVIALSDSGRVSINPGGGMTVTASGFAPGSPVEFFLESSPEPVALGYADTKGQAAQGFVLREDFPIGSHHLVARGLDPDGQPREVRRATTVEQKLPWWWLPAIAAAVAGLAGALVLGLVARHRRRNPNRVRAGHGSDRRPRRGRRAQPHPNPSPDRPRKRPRSTCRKTHLPSSCLHLAVRPHRRWRPRSGRTGARSGPHPPSRGSAGRFPSSRR